MDDVDDDGGGSEFGVVLVSLMMTTMITLIVVLSNFYRLVFMLQSNPLVGPDPAHIHTMDGTLFCPSISRSVATGWTNSVNVCPANQTTCRPLEILTRKTLRN